MAEILYESSYYGVSSLGDSLEHHGIKGQKWGIRRFQNSDGSLTSAGKQRYSVKMAKKYHLFEEHPNSAQAWDNARYIKDAGGRHSEIKKYLRENKFSSNEIKEWAKDNGYGRRIRDDIADYKAKKAEKERERAYEKGDAEWALKNASKLSTKDLQDIVGRANTLQQLNRLSEQAKADRRETLKKIVKTAAILPNAVIKTKQTYDKLHEVFKRKEKKSEADELYDKWMSNAVKDAMEKARTNASGSAKDKEFAAYMTAKNMVEGAKEAKKRAAKIDKAHKIAEARQKRNEMYDKLEKFTSEEPTWNDDREKWKKKYAHRINTT